MKKLLTGCFSLALFALTMMPVPAEAATPQDGHYKGTITIRTVMDGTNVRVKKPIPVAGKLAGGKMFLVMAEKPDLERVTSSFFNCDVSDGAVTLRSNANANWITLANVTTTTSTINGSSDFGVFLPPTGSGAARVLLIFSVTRVGN